MTAAADGATPAVLAARFGYASQVGVSRAVAHARDRVFPIDIVQSITVESRVLNVLAGAVMSTMSPGVGDDRFFRSSGLVLRNSGLVIGLRDARIEASRAALDRDWAELLTSDLGVWTESLTMRGDGWSFHDIAAELGFDDFFDANQLVATHLARFEHGCAGRLRSTQTRVLTRELHGVWDEATGPVVRHNAAARAVAILERRFAVRGIGLRFRTPMIDHSPHARR